MTASPTTDDRTTSPFIDQAISIVHGYIVAGCLVIGVVGNILSVVVFIRNRKRQDACVQYLGVLAISDTATILTRGVVDWMKVGLPYITKGAVSIDILQLILTCKLLAFLQLSAMRISAWMIIDFSVERAFVVWFPLKRRSITPRKRRVLISVTIALMISLSVHRLFLLYPKASARICYYIYISPELGALVYQLDLTLYSYAPCVIIFLANSFILAAILKSRDRDLGKRTTKSTNEKRLLLSLMLVSTLYVVFLLPFSTVSTLMFKYQHTLERTTYEMLYKVKEFLSLFDILNYCINFVIYGCTLPFYRAEIVTIFGTPFQRPAVKQTKGMHT